MKRIFKLSLLAAVTLPLLSWIVSCTGKQEDEPVTENLKVILSSNVIQANGIDEVTFSVEYEGIDVTSESVIYSAEDGSEADLPDMKFSTETPGSYSFYAVYNSMKSETVTLSALESTMPEIPEDPQPESTDFFRRALVIQFTGVGCSFCPSSDAAFERLSENYGNNYVLVACHSRENTDPAWYGGPLKNVLETDDITPFVNVDMDNALSHSGGTDASGLNALTSEYRFLVASAIEQRPAKAGIAATTAYSADNVIVTMSLKVAETAEYKVGAWLLEDDIFGSQLNGTGISGNFDMHDNCLRYADYTGQGSRADYTGVSLGTVNAGETAEYTFVIKTESGWNIENCHLALFVSTEEDGHFYVNNAVSCGIGETVAYEYN